MVELETCPKKWKTPRGEVRVGLTWDVAGMDALMRRHYDEISEDHSPAKEALSVGIYLKARENFALAVKAVGASANMLGFFLFVWKQGNTWDTHTMLGEACRGRLALVAGRRALDFVFRDEFRAGGKQVETLVSRCPATNRPSLFFALRLGFVVTSRRLDWRKHGQMWPSVYVELKRKDYLCH